MLEILDGDFQAAVDAFEGLGIATSDPEVASNIGTAYFFFGRLDEAEALFRRAVELQPRDPTFHRNLGDLHLRRGRAGAARASFRRALELTELELARRPDNPSLRVQRALLAAKADDCPSATDGLDGLWQEVRSTAMLAHDVAQTWAVCGEREAALEAIAEAVAAGVSPEFIRAEDEFRELADDPEFDRALRPVVTADP
jgi:tetratricopeptide (TPR) repeat protein